MDKPSRPGPGPGHNTKGPVTRETLAFFTGQYTKQLQVVKTEQKELSRIKNRAASAGIKLEPWLMMLKTRDENSDMVFERLFTFRNYCRFLGLPIGGQLDLFEDATKFDTAVSQPLIDEDAGYICGLQDDDPERQGADYMRGYNRGVIEAAARHMELNKPANIKVKRHANSGA